MKELRTANELLGDPRAIDERVDAEGYVFFRDVIDRDLVDHVRRGVMAWFESQGTISVVDGEPIYRPGAPAYDDYPAALYETKLWEWFATRPAVRDFFGRVFGAPIHVLPIGEYQHTWPGKPGCWVKMHQDGPFFNHQAGPWGAGLDFRVFWFPLMEITEPIGGLAIVPSPREDGSLHRPLEQDASARFIPDGQLPPDAWHRADYRPGDALVFGPFTPHCGMPNTSDRLRLSIDIRVEPDRPGRQITGVVVDAGAEEIVLCADRGEVVRLTVDARTAMRLPSSDTGRHDPGLMLGRRVIVTADAGRAIAIRNGFGYLPWAG